MPSEFAKQIAVLQITSMGKVTELDYSQCHILFGLWMLFNKTPVQMACDSDQGN